MTCNRLKILLSREGFMKKQGDDLLKRKVNRIGKDDV